jgi:platelet-activating factor acetylhydrolase
VVPAYVDVPIAPPGSSNAPFPVLVWSHGDAGLRTFYSHLVGEIASRGAVVAAIEHRDGSCPATVEMKKDEFVRNVTYFGVGDVSYVSNSTFFTPVAMLFGIGEADGYDNRPPMSNDTFKFAQRALRQAEVEETINVLRNISNGNATAVFSANSRNEGQNLTSFQNRLDFGRLMLGGHSFGATSQLQALEPNATAAIPVERALVFDP